MTIAIAVTETTCNSCGKHLQLKHEDETREPIVLDAFGLELAAKLAKLITCDDCVAKHDEQQAAIAAAEETATRIERSGMPPEIVGLKWGDLDAHGKRGPAIAAASKWASSPAREARGLYLWGPTGTGKTTLAATAAYHRLQYGNGSLRWVNVADLLNGLERSYADKERSRSLDILLGDTALVLDDFDKVTPSESKRSQLYSAIDRRILTGAPLLITSNLSPQKLDEKFGEAIASRLTGYCLGRTFEMDGPDRRLTLVT